MILLFIERILKFFVRKWRKAVFKYKTGTKHNNFKLTGKVNILSSKVDIQIGQNVTIYDGVTFWGDAPIKIGNNTTIGLNTIIAAVGKISGGITIGDNTILAPQCYITDVDHSMGKGECIRYQPQTSAPVVIGDDVWIAANATILKGSVIHNGAVVGAKALVKGEIPEYGIAVGIPAKVVKYRK